MRRVGDIMRSDADWRALLGVRKAKGLGRHVPKLLIDAHRLWRAGGSLEECAAKAGMSPEEFRATLLEAFRGVRSREHVAPIARGASS